MEERLQNILAHAGVASRRAAAALVESGVVTVDGLVVREPGARFEAERVEIRVNGRPLATVTAKVGKTTGAISVSFTSKKGDKAKYAVELVWRGDNLFAGHVTRTWKEVDPETKKSANLTAYGTAEVK